jgi:hypothetical protein
MSNKLSAEQAQILDPKTIRERTKQIYTHALQGGTHFVVHLDQLDAVVDLVLEITKKNYPSGTVPVHGRYEHLRAGGIDRVAIIEDAITNLNPIDQSKALFDLVVASVLLDAGAGPKWQYTDKDGNSYSRSEGLAVASFEMFMQGAFSDDPNHPFQMTAKSLRALKVSDLEKGFQVSKQNPMEGLSGRLGLLNRLADSLEFYPEYFGDENPRPGHLIDYLIGLASQNPKHNTIEAKDILTALLVGFSKMWPARTTVGDLGLGDTWKYQSDGLEILVPFHKLSQWLTYSLIEPIEVAGLRVTEISKMTGLPEYRNGGLLLDMGVLTLKDPKIADTRLEASHPAIIEWRALTVQILDEIGNRTRKKLGKTEDELPLACVLQGGTWSAGREVAKKLRADGSPPLTLESDGTVF